MQIPGYSVERLLGRGTVGSAYLARGSSDGRQIVLKVIDLGEHPDKQQLKRFMLEYRVLSRIDHSNVVRIEERGFATDFAFIAMEYCAFGSLRQHIVSGGMSPERALDYLKQIISGLSAVHALNIAHRDLKPANLLMRDQHSLVITDFGVAKDLASSEELTVRGAFPGSIYYASPEQIQNQDSSPLSDLYSVGVMLYQMVVGRPPFVGRNGVEVLTAHLKAPVPRLPEQLTNMQPLLDGLLAKDTAERFQSCADVLSAITWTQCRM